jgi:hypothetical protein
VTEEKNQHRKTRTSFPGRIPIRAAGAGSALPSALPAPSMQPLLLSVTVPHGHDQGGNSETGILCAPSNLRLGAVYLNPTRTAKRLVGRLGAASDRVTRGALLRPTAKASVPML